MVKLAQYIDWPSSEPTAPSTTIAAITIGGRSDSRVFPQVNNDISAEHELVFVESKRHADSKHANTLADLFQSACVRYSERKTPPCDGSAIEKSNLQIQLIDETKRLSEVDNCIQKADNPTQIQHNVQRKNVCPPKATDLQLDRGTQKFLKTKHKQASKGHSVGIDSALASKGVPYVGHKTSSIDIPEKMVGLAWIDAEPVLLAPGSYSFPPNVFILERLHSEKTGFIKHGNLHRVYIREGHLGVAWVDGSAVLLEPGVSVHSCSIFSHVTTDDQMVLQKEFVLGPFRIVTVHANEVGIKFCNRKPGILYPGRHCLSISKVEVFAGFESLLRRQTNLPRVRATSSDDMAFEADIHVEWQIKPEDAAAARLANVTDVEGAVCEKLCRAFNFVLWDHKAEDLLEFNTNRLSLEVCQECLDLFGETGLLQGWTVTIWQVDIKTLTLSSLSSSNM